MAQMNPAEMEEFQNLSDRYNAELPGPLIGDKLPMNVLVTEYAQADPTFVVKTTGLAATHGAYRAVKGDGQCGWRATVYSYFEKILASGDIALAQQEKIRIQTFEDTMKMVGIDYDIIVDMFDYTWELFDKIMQAVEHQNLNDQVVLEDMNDEIKSNSIVYHFKMMTSAYMQLRADQYEPFLEMPIAEYRVARIDPSNQEIDQIGLQALTDAVISPAGFTLEVLYLDRSYGDEVTPHSFSENMQGAPTIRLLYRPGHYDIIYKDIQPVRVFLQNQEIGTRDMQEAPMDYAANDAFSAIYGAGTMPLYETPNSYSGIGYDAHSHYQQPQYNYYYQPSTRSYTDIPVQMPPQTMPQRQQQQPVAPPTHSIVHQPLPIQTQQQYQPPRQGSITGSSSSHSVPVSPSPPAPTTGEPQIRFTRNMYEMRRHESVPLGQNMGR